MLEKLVTDTGRLKEERRALARSGQYSRAAARQLTRACKSPKPLPAEAVQLVLKADYMCPRCRAERQRMVGLLIGKEPPLIQCELCKGFAVAVYKRLDRASACCFQPVVLKDGAPVKQIFVRSKTPEISLYHFAVPALDHFMAAGKWPEKQGIAIPS